MAFTDAVPLLERDMAAQAGLGWVGKNSCLIHPKRGSLFFIGEILTSLSCENSPELMHDYCGSCTACIDACPTDALIEPRVLDSNRCLAYWNIESKENPPEEIRKAMGDWFFGCDICQTICPWNIKLHKEEPHFPNKETQELEMIVQLRGILQSSNNKLLKSVKQTPLSRAGAKGLKRNALLVAGNMKLVELRDDITAYLDHETLGEMARWALRELEA